MSEPQEQPQSTSDSPEECEPAISILILDSIVDGLVILDRNWRYTFVNTQAERLMGRPRSELLGKCVWDEFPIAVGTEVEQQLRRAAAEQLTCEFEDYHAAWERWYENRASPTPDGGVAVYFRDVTERKRAEENLRRNEALLAEAQELANVGSWNWDLTTDLLTWSDEHYRIFGLERQDGPMTFERGISVIHPDDLPRVRRTVDEALRAHEPYNCSLRLLRHDGSVRFVHSRGRTVYDPNGEPLRMYGTVQDVTERRQAEEALRESEERIRQLVALMPAGVYTCDAQGRITFYNRRAAELWGREPRFGDDNEEFCGSFRLWRTDGSPLSHDQTPMAAAVREGGSVRNTEVVIEQPEGVRVVVSVNVDPLHDRDGRRVGAINVFEDISDRKRAEAAVRDATERLELAIRGSNIGIWDVDLAPGSDYRREPVRFINVWEQLGYDAAEFPADARASRALGHPDDLAHVDRAVAACLAGITEEIRVENRIRHKDGSYHWLLTLGNAVRDASGRPVRLIGTVLNITERKRADEALRESEAKFRALAEHVPSLVWSCTLDKKCDYVNAQFLRYTGQSEAELLGDWPLDNIHADDHATMFAAWEHSMSTGAPAQFEARVRRHDGAWRWFQIRAAPLRDERGQLIKWFGTNTDIDDLKRAEEDLRRAKEAAEAANRAKDEFLANVSHEIRTPFGAILGMTEVVLDTPLTDDQRECLETVKSAADSLLTLVDDLLDFEKIEAGKMELVRAHYSLRAMMADTLRALTVRAQMKGLALVCNVEPDVPDALVGDAGRLRQVLLNLVANAIKFTKQGEVAVRVEVANDPTPGELALLRFTVCDTGIGIPLDGQERIFRAFEQADSSTTREFGGTGLGLTIAARLVGLLDGKIALESEPGRGSTFSFTARFGRQPYSPGRIDAQPSDDLRDATAPIPAGRPLRILVAEDNEFNVRHLQRLLRKRGHEVQLANNGREALALLGVDEQGEGAKTRPERQFDVLLLDLHMPELDGFHVIGAIRERERTTGGHLPVIAVTARSRREDREQCLAAGMDDYLSKPVFAAELFATIDRFVSAHGESRPAPPEPGDHSSLLDPVTLLAACDGDAEGLRELCRDFQAYAPARLAEVSDALRDRDAPQLREAAHKLRGLLAAFSAVAGDIASNLEEHAARGLLDEARPLAERLDAITRELDRHVQGLSLESLRRQAGTANDPSRTAGSR